MINNERKRQNLRKLALISPILLLLLLIGVDVGRTIWAYLTVQQAARMAVRYAVIGKPYINPRNSIPLAVKEKAGGACTQPEGELGANQPWECNPRIRAEVIKKVAWLEAEKRIDIEECPPEIVSHLAGFRSDWNCNNRPGVFGVQVVGEVMETTLALTEPFSKSNPVYVNIYVTTRYDYSTEKQSMEEKLLYVYQAALPNHAGHTSLLVRVTTFYNVQIFTPLFKVITGSSSITVRGDVIMQNEGICPPDCFFYTLSPIRIESNTTEMKAW